MTRPPQAENAGLVAAGTALKEYASEIVQLWLTRAVADPRFPSHHRADLRNHLPQLLYRMGSDLAEGRGRQSSSTERAGEAHGHQRWQLGWSLEGVVHDFQTLRPLIGEVLQDHLESELSDAARRALDLLIDEAIIDSINSFTRSPLNVLMGMTGLPVLVVDDNLTSRRAVSDLLETWGMRVVAVEGSQQALAALDEAESRGAPFPLALIDALMPGIDGLTLAARIATDSQAPRTILMVAPADRVALRDRLRTAPFAAIVDKPVAQAALRDTIVGTVVAGVKGVNANCEPPKTNLPAAMASLNVLLVEDTAANRKIVERVLGKRGHRVTNAFNGREAFELVRQEQFDVILMDVQMPIMDGFQAATAIRQWETENQLRPIPIIAMTANAMQADRDRCYAAGMSGYIAKPMDIYQLAQTVENSARNQNGAPPATVTGPVDTPPPRGDGSLPDPRESIDLEQSCKRLRGDRVLLVELIKCYHDDYEILLEQIRQALDQGEAKVAHRMAHNLKGLASNFDAVRTPYFAQQVELASAAGDLDEARRNLPMLVESARELAHLLLSADQR